YLLKHPFQDLNELKSLLDWIISDYNHRHPHHSLGGLIPIEALQGIKPPKEEWKTKMKDAKQSRIKENTSENCGIC
ncbi:MAG: integrase core domain-containing protein, partial [Bacteroidota bacterium]|nr:integrase core domain-containing protein [Bacteroidota bacterium]